MVNHERNNSGHSRTEGHQYAAQQIPYRHFHTLGLPMTQDFLDAHILFNAV